MTYKKPLPILKMARRAIANGWAQGVTKIYSSPTNSYCAFGAIREYAATSDDVRIAIDCVYNANPYIAAEGNSLISWNDETGRKQAEVVAAFDRAIEKLEPSVTAW